MAKSEVGDVMEKRTGKFGCYYAGNIENTGKKEIYFMTGMTPGVDIIDGGIAIPAQYLAAFCTELIEMARVLGVTGGQDERLG